MISNAPSFVPGSSDIPYSISLDLERKEREANQGSARDFGRFYNRPQDYELNKARPLLDVVDGKVVPRGSGG